MDPIEFLKQADLYEDVDANILDRIYKMLMVSSVSHPLTIVRARESVNWAQSREYNDILEGRYPRTPGSGTASNGSRSSGQSNATATSTPPSSNQSNLIRCPHCGREQMNQRFCSLCGGTIA
jgi:ribosomal protein L37E